MNTRTIIITVLVVIALLILYIIITYKNLKKLQREIKERWEQIEKQIKRRFEIIPNIVETVKRCAKDESSALKGIIEARNKWNVAVTNEQKMDASEHLNESLKKLHILKEKYPSLKTNNSYIKLNKVLEETQNEIANLGERYNETVEKYNKKIKKFPSKIVAKIIKFQAATYYKKTKN